MARSRWKFQIKPNQPDVVAVGYRMDAVGQAVEGEVNRAMPFPLRFHKIHKIVVCLGPAPERKKDYVEMLTVGLKQWPDFNVQHYRSMSDADKMRLLRRIVMETFDWFLNNFPDAEFVEKAKSRLGW